MRDRRPRYRNFDREEPLLEWERELLEQGTRHPDLVPAPKVLDQIVAIPQPEVNRQAEREAEALAKLVNALLDERKNLRYRKRFKEADRIRDMLTEAGITIKDNGLGTSWVVK